MEPHDHATVLRETAHRLQPELVRLRRDLHAHPETGLDLPRTQAAVIESIDALGLEVSRGSGLTSVTAVLRGGRPGPAVLLRADMDALPQTEATGLDYASRTPGAMHACGHDLHTAALVGAAHTLAEHRDLLAGDVVFMFQPGEEGWDGAARMIDEGVLDAAGSRVRAAYGLHVRSYGTARGVFRSRPGALMGGVDAFTVTVHGAGGHASMPHLANDPIPVAAQIITSIPPMLIRRFDALDPVVVTVTSVRAGSGANIIPERAELTGTIRTFSAANRPRIRAELTSLCGSVALASGTTAEVTYRDGYPVTVNDPDEYEFAAAVVRDALGPDRFEPMATPIAAAEDFSRVLNQVPGCYLHLGASAADDPSTAATNHSPYAVFDDSVLADASFVLAELARRALDRLAAS
ncbi:M20 family metallopeptidase [Verrucosispora sp. WMMD573]|uniref:M20 metallopeptidase family protein n=1 Tax=Verrucosispora sp. WMMD573 TaxID=3015149 RepID=UPI00248AC60E|nr:M20 family metallopeptidase [Verrucosispora sp. WMMD573]WBB53813.1 M20 family metallopeptidase [Verrucosispora sp. WMMD573]